MRTVQQSGGWSPHHFCDGETFTEYMKFAKNPVAAAILYLGDRLCNELHDFDHQIKLGIEGGVKELAHEIGGLGDLSDIAREIGAAVDHLNQKVGDQ